MSIGNPSLPRKVLPRRVYYPAPPRKNMILFVEEAANKIDLHLTLVYLFKGRLYSVESVLNGRDTTSKYGIDVLSIHRARMEYLILLKIELAVKV